MSDPFATRPMRFMDGPYEGCRQIIELAFEEGHTINVPTGEAYLVSWNSHDMRWEAWQRQSADDKLTYSTSNPNSRIITPRIP